MLINFQPFFAQPIAIPAVVLLQNKNKHNGTAYFYQNTRIPGLRNCRLIAFCPENVWLASKGAETVIPVALGAGTVLYSLLTDYEMGAARVIPMPVHLGLDIASGLFLAASPWLFGFSKKVWAPHVAVGLMEVATALLTEMRPGNEDADVYNEIGLVIEETAVIIGEVKDELGEASAG
jgi:hypothetical protein